MGGILGKVLKWQPALFPENTGSVSLGEPPHLTGLSFLILRIP